MDAARKIIRVLIVDSSALSRETLAAIINADPLLEVMAAAADAYEAAEHIREEVPDVIFLEPELPRMDGLTFLRKIMAQHPIPVVICSDLHGGSEALGEAIEAGAIGVVPKPRVGMDDLLEESRTRICSAAKGAPQSWMRNTFQSKQITQQAARPRIVVEPKLTADVIIAPLAPGKLPALLATMPATEKVVCIGASTGGTEALREILQALPAGSPAIVVVQHMPEKFTGAFARRLDGLCSIEVKEAEDGDLVLPGRALIAPGMRHMMLLRTGLKYSVEIVEGPAVARHRPSVDVLFRSAAYQAGPNGMGILLTGMGDDGARGMVEMKNMGALTIAQDEETSVVFGMPKEAIERGACTKVLPLGRMAQEIINYNNTEGAARTVSG